MKGLFSPNNLFFRSLSWMVDIVGISFLWLLLTVPVVTAVPAGAALYHTCALCVRRGEDGAFGRFFRSFRQNLRQGCILSVPVAALGVMLLWGRGVMLAASNQVGGYATVMYGIYDVVLFLPLGICCWMVPLLGRFEFGSRELFRTAMFLTLRHLPATVFTVVVVLGTAVLCLAMVPLLLLLPVGAAVLLSFPMERVFRRYLPD